MRIFMISHGWNPCGIQTALIEYGDVLHVSFLPSVLYAIKTIYDGVVMWSKLSAFCSFSLFKIPVHEILASFSIPYLLLFILI